MLEGDAALYVSQRHCAEIFCEQYYVRSQCFKEDCLHETANRIFTRRWLLYLSYRQS